jgi:mono/diheme cytochrome c family protein
MLTLAALVVLTAGCVERKNAGAPLPPKQGPGPTIVATTNEAPVEDANAPPGRKVYNIHGCGKCHRIDAPGGPAGPGKAPNLARVGAQHPADWIAVHVRDPKTHKAQSRMPAYPETKISDADLKTLSEYLASLK